MPILDIQKRARELGRIRIGQVVATTKRDGTTGTRPEKLDRFRLTSASKPLLEKVAHLYGGTVEAWTPQGGGPQAWEVVTTSTRLPIMVPPQPVSQWYEYWTGGGCKHRCDGHTNVLTDELCDPEDFNHREALKRPTTRLSVVLRDVEGIGVWRLETHGWNAAVELPDAAEFLARAGGYVNGWVSLEERTSKAEVPDRQNGGTKIETRRFMVPIIEIDVTPAQLMAGQGRITPPTIEGPVARPALEAGQKAIDAPARPDYEGGLARATSRDDVTAIWRHAKENGFLDPDLEGACATRATELAAAVSHEEAPVQGVVVEDPPVTQDADAIWQQILKLGGELGATLAVVTSDFEQHMALSPAEASAGELQAYLVKLQQQGIDQAVPA